ncbi:DUF2786 domain-containing protein [Pseudonocardiaceae bacterium YIM PH 21723]|nr:DUF2786 domain-containing protein [Pseudonocardiaceae bacterium YIM PH 21723]
MREATSVKEQSADQRPDIVETLWWLVTGTQVDPAEQADVLLRNPNTRLVDQAVHTVSLRLLRQSWQRGWLPEDVLQMSIRRCGAEVRSLVVDLLAAETAQYAPPTVDERWLEQLRAVGAEPWWDREAPHLSQWTARHGVDRIRALTLLLAAQRCWSRLPVLARILPLPGSATQASGGVRGVDQKVLARVRALLAKAESTGYAAEAEALSAKAQQLMAKHAFERAMLADPEPVDPTADVRRLWLDSPYTSAKSAVVSSIARANRCRAVYYDKLGFVAVVGDQTDLQIVELLATSLLVQATRAMLTEGSHRGRFGESRTRSYRQSFLVAYAARIEERLQSANEHSAAEVGSALVPVLAERERMVTATFAELFPNVRTGTSNASNPDGWYAGRAAADRADLGLNREALTG